MMLIIFSYAFWPFPCLHWRNVYLDCLPIFWLSCLFFWHGAAWAVYTFWKFIPVGHFTCKYLIPFCRLSFCFVYGFLAGKMISSLIRQHLFVFVFIFTTLGGDNLLSLLIISNNIAVIIVCVFNMLTDRHSVTPLPIFFARWEMASHYGFPLLVWVRLMIFSLFFFFHSFIDCFVSFSLFCLLISSPTSFF